MEEAIVTDIKKLRVVSEDTTQEEVDGLNLVSRLIKANSTAWSKGCGLAAIQIGIPLRFAWLRYNGKDHILLNPEIVKEWGEHIEKEGCLSIPDKHTNVKRAWTIEYISGGIKRKKRKVSGYLARIIQHEIDHMNGTLNIDKSV